MTVYSKTNRWKRLLTTLLASVLILLQTPVCAQAAATFIWPTPGSTGLYRGFGNGHYGLDIAADAGTPVFASAAGTVQVVYTGCKNFDGAKAGGKTCRDLGICSPSKSFYKDGFCNSAYGNAVMIKHDDGTWTAYAHLTSVASGIKVGVRVSQGQQLGISGSTGRSSGAHLHFEMRTGSGSGEEFWLADAFDPMTKVDPSPAYPNDHTPPVISNVSVYDVTEDGYWVSCTVTDDESGVDRVQFPTWTTRNGQDDLAKNWNQNTSVSGKIDGTYVTFYVSKQMHKWESGVYQTHIYAFDNAGNHSVYILDAVTLPAYGYAADAGDVDGNGRVEASDALLLLKNVVHLTELDAEQLARADISRNQKADAVDALYILQAVVGLIVLE